MSTKTTFKRISLVAVAGLVSGLVSVAPANAALVSSTVTSVNLAATSTNTNTIGSTVAVNVGAVIPSQTLVVGDNIRFTGVLTSYPAGGFTAVSAARGLNGVTANITTTGSIPTYGTGLGGTSTVTTTSSLNLTATATTAGSTITATTTTAGFGSFTFAPAVAGVYVLTVFADGSLSATADGTVQAGEPVQTISITVAAASAFSTGTSSAYIVDGNTTAVGTVTTDALGASGSKSMSIANVGAITVSLKDAANVAMTSGNTITATLSGVGGLGATAVDAPVADQCSATTVVRSVTLAADAVNTVYLCADGTSGVGTVTISVTNAAGITAVLATRTVTFYGSVSALAISAQPMSVLRAGGYQTGAIAALTGLSATTTPAVVVKATDSSGNVVQGLTITAVSSNTSVIGSSTVTEDVVGVDADATYGGDGYYVAHVTSATSSKSGESATVTYRIVNPADLTGLTYLTAVATFTVGGSVDKEALSINQATYAPGEAMVITLTGTDSSGNPVYDGAASPAVTANKAFGGTLPVASWYIMGKKATSATAPTVYAPAIGGEFILTSTSGNTAATVLTTKGSVVNAEANEATDAANAATDAANAATDAALAAADAADSATAAAEDASAAVAKLAKSVSTALTALKKQITALTALVNKLLKK